MGTVAGCHPNHWMKMPPGMTWWWVKGRLGLSIKCQCRKITETSKYFVHIIVYRGRMPSESLVAIRRLNKNGWLWEALCKDLAADVIEPDTFADVLAGLLDDRVPVHVRQEAETESEKKILTDWSCLFDMSTYPLLLFFKFIFLYTILLKIRIPVV